jgi:hypothetical protein
MQKRSPTRQVMIQPTAHRSPIRQTCKISTIK